MPCPGFLLLSVSQWLTGGNIPQRRLSHDATPVQTDVAPSRAEPSRAEPSRVFDRTRRDETRNESKAPDTRQGAPTARRRMPGPWPVRPCSRCSLLGSAERNGTARKVGGDGHFQVPPSPLAPFLLADDREQPNQSALGAGVSNFKLIGYRAAGRCRCGSFPRGCRLM